MRLLNKVVIVTGSAGGIGKAIAIRCVAEGARVLIHDRDGERAAAAAADLGPERAALHVEDLAADGCAARIVEKAIQAFGRIDALVNNAAIVPVGNIHETTAEQFAHVLSINTIAPFLLIQAALPYLRKSRGAVLNIGSVNAYSGEPNLLPYAVSKGALMTMTRNLGDTLMREDQVRVNQINPGWVLTENEARRKQAHGLKEDWYASLPKVYAPSGRILWPEEIAAAAIYLLGDECGPVSGQVLDLEQHPFIGRNPPKDASTIPSGH
jgi:NAD(P)-dependent dehydrogenase (short-subunit alcohol dehydrogenase family)